MAETERPLSPHLGIWRWRLHMALSIAHRGTGIVNAVGALILVWGLVALAVDPEYFRFFLNAMGSLIGRLILFGLTFSAMLHLCTGIRHLVMDTGRALELQANKRAGQTAIAAAVLLTLALWVGAYASAGAL